jgi:hypothetical protein
MIWIIKPERKRQKKIFFFIKNLSFVLFTLNYNKKMVALLDPSMNLVDK